MPSTTVSAFIYAQPVVAAVGSVLLLGEVLSPLFYLRLLVG